MSAIPAPTAPAASLVSLRTRLETFSHWFLRPEVLIRVSVYLTTLIYLRTVLFDYVYDDNYLIILNPWMESWRSVPTLFTHSFWSFTEAVRGMDFYRPLVMLTLVSIRHLLGTAPGWFHLVATGIHVLATYLTYRLALETTDDQTVSAIAAGIFGLHPTKVETAAWISGISDSLCVVFFLGSMIAYFKWKKRENNHDLKYPWMSLSLLFLALFSKEAAVFAPVLIAIYEFASTKAEFRPRCIATLSGVWPFIAVTLLAIGIRVTIVRAPSGHLLNDIPFPSTLLTAPAAIAWYLGKQLWPADLSPEYPLLVISTFSLTRFLIPLAALVLLAVAIICAVRRSATGIFFTSWFLLTLAPVVIYQVGLQHHDRYFYLASVSTSIGLAYLLAKLKQVGGSLQAISVAATFLLFAALTTNYASYWDNDLALFTRTVQIAPYNSKACRNLAGVYLNRHQPEKAEAMADNLINHPEGRAVGWYILGSVRLEQKDYESARDAMQKSIELSTAGNHLLASMALADTDMLVNRDEEAVDIYRQELKVYPQMPYLHKRLEAALRKISKSSNSQRELQQPHASSVAR